MMRRIAASIGLFFLLFCSVINADFKPLDTSVIITAFTASAITANINSTVNFSTTIMAGNATVSYLIDFGDGQTMSGIMRTTGDILAHNYQSIGRKTIQLRITADPLWSSENAAATMATTSVYINGYPTASFFVKPTANMNEIVTFNASASTDDVRIASYSWDFGDSSASNLLTVPTTSHSFASGGTKNVLMLIRDIYGLTNTISFNIYINFSPTVILTVSPITANTPATLNFSAVGSTDNDGIIINYLWNFGNGTTLNTETPTTDYYYETPGTRNVSVTVMDNVGVTKSAALNVHLNFPPTASFTILPTTANIPSTIILNASGSTDLDGRIINYQWIIDGTITVNRVSNSYSHLFSTPGTHDIVLIVSDNFGMTSTTSNNIYCNYSPTATFTLSQPTGNNPSIITLDASGSTDFDGTISWYQWTFKNTLGSVTQTITSIPILPYTFSQSGTTNITLNVIDNNGASSTTTSSVYINYAPTVSLATLPPSGNIPSTITFSATAIDTDGTISRYNWSFGDGTSASMLASIVTHTYTSGGTYNISITVIDNFDVTAFASASIYINFTPTAQFATSRLTGNIPTDISFTDQSTDYENHIISRRWLIDGRLWSMSEAFGHTFSTPGTHNIMLTVSDNWGAGASTSNTIYINYNPTASIASHITTGNIPFTVVLDGSQSIDYESGTANFTYEWNFGDGTTEQTVSPVTFKEHIYQTPGTKNITLRVHDALGGVGVTTSWVYVNFNPTAHIHASPPTGNITTTINFDGGFSTDFDQSVIGWRWTIEGDTGTIVTIGITTNISFSRSGTHNIVLTVTDSWGAAGSTTSSIYINFNPTANFLPSVITDNITCTITFDATVATDNDGQVVMYAMDFGNGDSITYDAINNIAVWSYGGIVVSMTIYAPIFFEDYAIANTYNIRLTVWDNFNASSTITKSIKLYSRIHIGETYMNTIQQAINEFPIGDATEILINGGEIYNEFLIITKNISLRNSHATERIIIVAPTQNFRPLLISSAVPISVNITGFTFDGGRNLNSEGAGILITGNSAITVNIINCTVRNNQAHAGGGIANYGVLILTSSNIENNSAPNPGGTGGGIINYNIISLNSTLISGNMVYTNGAGIYSASGRIFSYRSRFSHNAANDFGGGIYLNSGTALLDATQFDSNQSMNPGAGIAAVNNSQITLSNMLIVKNNATNGGAGIYLNQSTANIYNSTFADNIASSGKAIFSASGGAISVYNSIFYHEQTAINDVEIFLQNDSRRITLVRTLYQSLTNNGPATNVISLNTVIGMDPVFMLGNYQLSKYSPFNNYGSNAFGVTFMDINNNLRITNNVIDLGAYETFDDAAPVTPTLLIHGWNGFATKNELVTLNLICSPDLYAIQTSGVPATIIHEEFATTASIILTLTHFGNTFNVIFLDRVGNQSPTFSLRITQDNLPTASFTYSMITGNIPLTITFNAANSTDNDGIIVLYQWEFSNGTVTSSVSPSIRIIFDQAQSLAVTLTVYDNELLPGIATRTITIKTKQIAKGLSLISIPYITTTDMAILLNNSAPQVFYWDTAIDPQFYLSYINHQIATFNLGHGYWVYVTTTTNLLNSTQQFWPTTQSFSISLNANWNLIGNPYQQDLAFSDLSVSYNGTLYTYMQAVQNGIIYDTFWEYDSTTTNYYIQASKLSMWKGYWLYAAKPCQLKFPAVVSLSIQASALSIKAKTASINGQVEFTLQDGTERDWSRLIFSPESTIDYEAFSDSLKAPWSPRQSIQLSLVNQLWDNPLAIDVRPLQEGLVSYVLVQNKTSRPLNLLYQTNTKVPGVFQFRWQDQVMEGQKSGKLVIAPALGITKVEVYYLHAIPDFQLTGLIGYPNPFNPISQINSERNITIEYTLSPSNASGYIKVFDINGRVIRTFTFLDGEPGGKNGLNQLVWDGRDNGGELQPNGLYVYLIKVQSADQTIIKKGKCVLWKK